MHEFELVRDQDNLTGEIFIIQQNSTEWGVGTMNEY